MKPKKFINVATNFHSCMSSFNLAVASSVRIFRSFKCCKKHLQYTSSKNVKVRCPRTDDRTEFIVLCKVVGTVPKPRDSLWN